MSHSSNSSPSRGGVFRQAVDVRVQRFTESISFDKRLYAHDIRGSIAHAKMLASVGLITDDEAKKLEATLLEIKSEIDNHQLEYRVELEDIHMHIEQALIDRLGDLGRKLHTARSRNDQVSTDFRMWCREMIDDLDDLLLDLQNAFVGRCDRDFDVIIPAYTHMQRAQPVIAAHYWLCYCEKFQRDRDRLADCRKRVNVCSLGVAAVAGTTLPIDRDYVAKELDFDSVAANSLDVSSDRDFVVEFAFVLTMIAEHLSTWADEWVLWSTAEFNFIVLPQRFCTGSSIMPQKINPDVTEIIRGKTGRVIGNLQTLLVLIKGLPLAYNRDLQEDKPPVFDSVDTVKSCLELAIPLVEQAELNREQIGRGIETGYLDATTLMEFMIKKGVPQRTAHHLVGSLVGKAAEMNAPLGSLPKEVFREAHDALDESVKDVLGIDNAVAAFQSYGSTAPTEVTKQIKIWKDRLARR